MFKHPNPVRLAENMILQNKFLKSVNVETLLKEPKVLYMKSRYLGGSPKFKKFKYWPKTSFNVTPVEHFYVYTD